jgi:hypothetical protein
MNMAEHKWTEGEGLRRGLPDRDWPMRKLITVYPINYINDEDGVVTAWNVQICWGDTWGHIAFGENEDFTTAMNEACKWAIKQGCPAEWLPYNNEEE